MSTGSTAFTRIARDLSWHVQFIPEKSDSWPVVTLGPDGTYPAHPDSLAMTVDEDDLAEGVPLEQIGIKICTGQKIRADGLPGRALGYRSFYLPRDQMDFIRPAAEAALAEIRDQARKLGIDVRESA
jgi:hypothetical protein